MRITKRAQSVAGASERRLEGRVAVVTGAAAGIGLAIGRALLAAGAELVALDRDERALARTARELGCTAVVGDLAADPADGLAEQVLAVHGTVDLIVNNVGITTEARFRELGEDDFDLVLATNLRGPWFFTRRLVDAVVQDKRPASILFISSLHATHVRHFAHYSASKAAVSMLVKELAHELGPLGIRVNSLSPGWIAERRNGPSAIDDFIPLRRAGEPDDVAPLAIALLDDAVSGYVTGADVVVDGGLALHSWLDDLPDAPVTPRP
jgi:NAD(P)-dependent dehydrogenase (short-subunit alcohol dehydrogenase family)